MKALLGLAALLACVGNLSAEPFISSVTVSSQSPETINPAYVLEATTDLVAPAWTLITTQMTGADGLFSYTDSDAPNYSTRIYRATLPY